MDPRDLNGSTVVHAQFGAAKHPGLAYLADHIRELIDQQGDLPLATAIGVLRLVEHSLIEDAKCNLR